MPVLDPDVVEFVLGGVGVATRDDDLRPAFARGWGPSMLADGRSLRLCVAAPSGSRVRANLERNGAIAVGFSPPTIARAVQVKGVAVVVTEPGVDDLERAERHFRMFEEETARIAAPAHVPGRMFVRSGLIAVEFSIDEAFVVGRMRPTDAASATRLRPDHAGTVANRHFPMHASSYLCAAIFPAQRELSRPFVSFLRSGGGGNRTRVRGRTGQSVYERSSP